MFSWIFVTTSITKPDIISLVCEKIRNRSSFTQNKPISWGAEKTMLNEDDRFSICWRRIWTASDTKNFQNITVGGDDIVLFSWITLTLNYRYLIAIKNNELLLNFKNFYGGNSRHWRWFLQQQIQRSNCRDFSRQEQTKKLLRKQKLSIRKF